MSYVLAVRALEEELYSRLPEDFLVLNFCFKPQDYFDGEDVININMNDYGIMNPSYTLLREKGLAMTIENNVSSEDTLLLYVKDIETYDGFLNITNKSHFLANFMYKRKYLNYYLHRIPTIFERPTQKERFDNYLKELVEYGNVVPIRILRNFLIRSNDSTNRIMAVNVANAILDIVSGYNVKNLRKVKRINKMKSKVYHIRQYEKRR
ncbi:MAG: hypothetical protein IKM20_10630 [Erysipelotrichales bacterium]|nr:hypothetical protein [Erysipelotrichales bacterium]